MSDTFNLLVTIQHKLDTAAEFFDAGETRDTLQSYINSQAVGSWVKFEYNENPGVDPPILVTSLLNVVIASRTAGATKMSQIDNNLDTLPGSVKVTHSYTETDTAFS